MGGLNEDITILAKSLSFSLDFWLSLAIIDDTIFYKTTVNCTVKKAIYSPENIASLVLHEMHTVQNMRLSSKLVSLAFTFTAKILPN